MHADILAVGAHPDDVELCCAGTLAKLVTYGYRAVIVDVTGGELGTRGTRAIRLKEAREAASILGCTRINLGIPDGNIAVNSANVGKLIRVIRDFRPRIIFIPHWLERHPDHVHTHHLAREAWFYAGLRKIRTRMRGKPQEPWRPENYYHFMQWYEFAPSFIVDITDVHDRRLRAIRAHKSQFHNPKSKEPQTILSQRNFLEIIENRARTYGAKIGTTYAEPFFSIEKIGIDNPLELRMFRA